MKKALFALLVALGVNASATQYKYEWIYPTEVLAGDFITRPVSADPGDNSSPWLEQSGVSQTALVFGNVISTTATAATFQWIVPDNFKGGASLFAVVEPDDNDITVKLTANCTLQPSFGVDSDPSRSTSAHTAGTASSVLGADADGEFARLTLANSLISGLTKNDRRRPLIVNVGRTSGTGEDLKIYAFCIKYEYYPDEKQPNN